MHWLYLLIASFFEVCWLYSLKLIDLKKIKSIPVKDYFSSSEIWMNILPVIGYIAFGIGNIIFFSLAMRRLPASTAFAVWLGVAMAAAKVVDIAVFKEPYSGMQILFILLILTGIVGLRMSS